LTVKWTSVGSVVAFVYVIAVITIAFKAIGTRTRVRADSIIAFSMDWAVISAVVSEAAFVIVSAVEAVALVA
jgi:hypothetical protein